MLILCPHACLHHRIREDKNARAKQAWQRGADLHTKLVLGLPSNFRLPAQWVDSDNAPSVLGVVLRHMFLHAPSDGVLCRPVQLFQEFQPTGAVGIFKSFSVHL